MKNNYDVIVIGSGCGGLAAAARVASAGKQVLVLEQHNIPGGCGTSFKRGRFEFEVALHQLSQMGTFDNPGSLRKLFREFGIEEQIDWIEIKELYNVIQPEYGIDCALPVDMEQCKVTMKSKFPDEAKAIDAYYDLVWAFAKEYFALITAPETPEKDGLVADLGKLVMSRLFAVKYPTLGKYLMRSSQDVLDELGLSQAAQNCVNTYWCFMGMPPQELPFAILAACTYLYIKNLPHYLKGGSQVISQALSEYITSHGGEMKFSTPVKRLVMEGDKAVGVTTEDGTTYYAKKIISNISHVATYVNLLEDHQIKQDYLASIAHCKVGVSAFTCFIGLDCPPEAVGIHTSFNILYPPVATDPKINVAKQLDMHSDPIVFTCYTVDDPSVSPEGTSMISTVCLKYAQPWIDLDPKDYYATKYEIAKQQLDRLEIQFPGLIEHIEEIEVATPLTHMRYLHHPGGAIYGFEQDLNATGFFFPTQSKIENLEFASGWARLCGFGPNYTYGNTVAKKILEELK